MENPWTRLPRNPPYVLEDDLPAIDRHNACAPDSLKVHLDLRPEPYAGNPDADVILLTANPGYSIDDFPFQEHPRFLEIWRRNLLHQPIEYPLYFLDPVFDRISGPCWWHHKLAALIRAFGPKVVAQRLCCIEYFPYHSKRFGMREQVPSQHYVFHLVAEAVEKGQATIVIMRRERLWLKAVPSLASYDKLYRLNSRQNISLTPRNCPKGYPRIAELLR